MSWWSRAHLNHHGSKTCSVFEMKRGLKDEKASPTSVFSLMLIIYVVCAFYYYYLFIYNFLFSSLPAFFSKASWTGKMYQTFEFSFKRLSLSLSYLYIYSSLHLSCCYLARRMHEALMRSKPDTHC